MTIKAKFASICPICSKGIEVGANVEWSKGQKAKHAECIQSKIVKNKPFEFNGSTVLNVSVFDAGGFQIEFPRHGEMFGSCYGSYKTLTGKEGKSFLMEREEMIQEQRKATFHFPI